LASDKSLAQEKTEEATPLKRREARKKGQVAKSADLNSALNLFAVAGVVFMLQAYFAGQWNNYFYRTLASISTPGGNPIRALVEGSNILLALAGPILLTAFVTGLITNLLQVGLVFSLESLQLKLDRLNPVEGFKRMFSFRTLVELAKSLAKMTVIVLVVFFSLKKQIPVLLGAQGGSLEYSWKLGKDLSISLTITAVLALMVIALVDLFYQKFEHRKSLRMTKQEVKDELKQTEGDPHFKARLRERQRQMAFRRMVQEVPQATVVVTNPTHYAVALKYQRGEMNAPRVVAKGADRIAERIKKIAREHQVPLVENKPVAQFLYRHTEVGEAIPEQLYQAVAEILALVYRKHKRNF